MLLIKGSTKASYRATGIQNRNAVLITECSQQAEMCPINYIEACLEILLHLSFQNFEHTWLNALFDASSRDGELDKPWCMNNIQKQ